MSNELKNENRRVINSFMNYIHESYMKLKNLTMIQLTYILFMIL